MQVDVKDITGKKIRSIELPKEVFAVELNEHVLHTAVKGYLANKRQGTHATKTRSLVSGGGKKPFKQKGTGNARQGSTRSPLQPGGAVSHGPQPRDYRQKLNKKARQLALRVALSDRAHHSRVVVVDDFALSTFNTKHVIAALGALGAPNALVADERKDNFLYRSARNIHGVGCITPAVMNAEDVLKHEALVISETAIKALSSRLLKDKDN